MKKLMLMTVMMTAIAAPAAMAEGTHKDGGMWFSKVDANGDGLISQAEHEKASAEKFAKMDANKDGNISKEEAMAAKSAMKEKIRTKVQEKTTTTTQ
ncbi:MAG: hypothetical protein DI551_05550 [Micavibrio aeruginosavorus]|uniref:EF-hand domain-containing protein n=1 Tax=Micavibrio aeruginosavorus TaxID=349221 RepID=A0A2W5N637_9BACT|nr:MAG: hypothetical protein DI551_05550 [Micavibrio aeruginosavorus]